MFFGQLRFFLRPAYCIAVILTLHLSNSFASECDSIQYDSGKSRNVSISQNDCQDKAISIGTVISLAPGARLWLHEGSVNKSPSYDHLICQSKSWKIIKLKISQSSAPWIKVTGQQNCTSWTHNKLICTDTSQQSGSLFCIIKTLKKYSVPKNQQIERTTSVTMRSLKTSEPKSSEDLIKQTFNAIGEEVELCKDLYTDGWAISTAWHIDANTKAQNVRVTQNIPQTVSPSLIDCIESVIKTYPYPDSLKNIRMNYRY